MKIKITKDYRQARAECYPPLQDFVEALSEKELGNPAKWNKYLSEVQAVREKYPKPTPQPVKKKS